MFALWVKQYKQFEDVSVSSADRWLGTQAILQTIIQNK